MTTKPIRTYTASDVQEIVELLRDDPDISPEKFEGMAFLAEILKCLESKTDADIDRDVRAFCRNNPFFPFRSSD